MTFCKLSHGYALNNDLGGGVFQAGGHVKKMQGQSHKNDDSRWFKMWLSKCLLEMNS